MKIIQISVSAFELIYFKSLTKVIAVFLWNKWPIEICCCIVCIFCSQLNRTFTPFHSKIRMHILPTALHIFPKVLARRICLIIKSFFSWWSFLLFSWPKCVIQWWCCKEKLDAGHSWGGGGQRVNQYLANYLFVYVNFAAQKDVFPVSWSSFQAKET